jgi:small-conductance mechanosensitive channel
MYRWIVFLHVIGILGFLLSHGASASVAFALRRERNPERVNTLLDLSSNSYGLMYISLIILLVCGIILGFMGRWWQMGWIWVSLLLLFAILVVMYAYGTKIYAGIREAVELTNHERGQDQSLAETASSEEIDKILKRGNPVLLTVIGYGGFAIITWLMIFKPF